VKSQSVFFAVVVSFLPQASQAAMDKGYYSNAREACQLHAQMKAGKRPPVDKARALMAKVTPINKGKNLQVIASDELDGKNSECSCLFGPGDADLYPSVRLAEPPNCAVR
jgi:hypothetical protein